MAKEKKENEFLTEKELKRLYKVQVWARPVLMYIMAVVFFMVSLVILYLLSVRYATVNEASSVLMVIVGVIAPVLTAQVLGRSYEKGKGMDNTIPAIIQAQSNAQYQNYSPRSGVDPSITVNIGGQINDDDPFAGIRDMDLSEYESRVADDEPSFGRTS